MSLEQNIIELNATMKELIEQLKLGRSGTPAESKPATEAKAKAKVEEPKVEESKVEESKVEESKPLDYLTDVAPRFSMLAARDRAAALAMIAEYNPTAKKLGEAIKPEQYAEVLAKINALLEG